MESNGKSITKSGERVDYETGVRVYPSISIFHDPLSFKLSHSLSSGERPVRTANILSTNLFTKAPNSSRPTLLLPPPHTILSIILNIIVSFFPTFSPNLRRWRLGRRRSRWGRSWVRGLLKPWWRVKCLQVIGLVRVSCSRFWLLRLWVGFYRMFWLFFWKTFFFFFGDYRGVDCVVRTQNLCAGYCLGYQFIR